MTEYRTGNHHGVTICAEDDGARCGRPGHDCTRGHLVAVVVDGGVELAERIAWLLTHTCPTCMGPQRETVDMVCQTCGTDYGRRVGPCSITLPSFILGQSDHLCELPHGHTGDHVAGPTRWREAPETAPASTERPSEPSVGGSGRPEAQGGAEAIPADSCTCPPPSGPRTMPDPLCVVHRGRRAKGPKPPPLGPGCVCDGSGRTCPRHGAVL